MVEHTGLGGRDEAWQHKVRGAFHGGRGSAFTTWGTREDCPHSETPDLFGQARPLWTGAAGTRFAAFAAFARPGGQFSRLGRRQKGGVGSGWGPRIRPNTGSTAAKRHTPDGYIQSAEVRKAERRRRARTGASDRALAKRSGAAHDSMCRAGSRPGLRSTVVCRCCCRGRGRGAAAASAPTHACMYASARPTSAFGLFCPTNLACDLHG